MSNKSLTILVLISLAFNIAFLLGFIYTRLAGPIVPPKDKPPIINPHAVMEHLKIRKEQFKDMAMSHQKAQMDFYDELSNKEYDEDKLLMKLKTALDLQRTLDLEVGRSLIRYRANLTPEQAEKTFKQIYKNRKNRNPRFQNRQGVQK